MKKIITSLSVTCCILLVIFGVAQPLTGENHEILKEKFNVLSPLPQTQKNDVWLEPDTVYLYSVNGLEERRIFSYENNVCVVDLTQKLSNNQWKNSVKVSYSFDYQNNLVEELIQDYNETWKNRTKKTYTYDTRNNLTSTIVKKWEYEYYINNWINYKSEVYTYDSLNNLTEKLAYVSTWSGEGWYLNMGYEYTYDKQNNLTKMREKIWYPIDKYWITVDEFYYSYDVNNNLVEILSGYGGVRKITYTYNSLNYIVIMLVQKWQTDEWINCEKEMYMYDEQFNMKEKICQHWNKQWENDERHIYFYDRNNNATAGYAQKWINDQWIDVNSILDLYYHNMQSSYSINAHKFIVISYIEPKSIGINENNLSNSPVKLYPNPVVNMLYIETGIQETVDYSIYNLTGQVVGQGHFQEKAAINIASLAKGLYFLRINEEVMKVVKQ